MRQQLWPHADNQSDIDAFFAKEHRTQSTAFITESEDGTICGFVEVSLRHEYVEGASSSPVAYLEGWFVLPEWRGRGIGKQLIQHAERWAVDSGCTELASDSLAGNSEGIASHISCGFSLVSTVVHLIKKLKPNQVEQVGGGNRLKPVPHL